ncbi:MAG: putative Allantoicase [Pseudomonadota bacterium]
MSAPAAPATTSVFRGHPDLASSAMGGVALLCSDAFFAGMENLLHPHEAVWDADAYTDRGKWMDGWEPRRRRSPGLDWCIVKLGVPGDLVGVDIDTRHFLGNAPPFATLDAVTAPADATGEWLRDHADWSPVLDEVPLERGGHNVFALKPFAGATHVRLCITFPAGGVARLRVHGVPRGAATSGTERVDLASVLHGGRALACSDSFFSKMDNLIAPGRPAHMGLGWETKRSPTPRQDWVILALGTPGEIDAILLDTCHFKGNHPTGARVEGLYWPGAPAHMLTHDAPWQPVLPDTPLGPDREHLCDVPHRGPWTHLRLTTLSDGGVARLRAFGRPSTSAPGAEDPLLRLLNGLSPEAASEALSRCCGARRWVRQMVAARPFASRAHLFGEADRLWWRLGDGDWREAFTHHPRIGADVAALRQKFAATADWSSGEQAGVAGAGQDTVQALADGNVAYEAHFGYIFIVCATGLSATEMLGRLQARMGNEPAFELRIAAGEQARITKLRLEKLTA